FSGYVDVRPLLDLFYIGDLPRSNTAGDPVANVLARVTGSTTPAVLTNTFSSAYWPWVSVADPVGAGANPSLTIPCAGHVAGLFARTDGRRGVWKSPAGVE